jgi:hypothetical protein
VGRPGHAEEPRATGAPLALRARAAPQRHAPGHPPHQSLVWEEPPVTGPAPCPRSGHSFTAVGDKFYVFGGNGRLDGERRWAPPLCGQRLRGRRERKGGGPGTPWKAVQACGPADGNLNPSKPQDARRHRPARRAGKAQAFNDLFELDASNPEQYRWRLVACANPPPARSRHAAVAVSGAWRRAATRLPSAAAPRWGVVSAGRSPGRPSPRDARPRELPSPPLSPCPRLSQLDERRLLILGGVDRRTRFDDLWVFDAAAEGGKGAWSRAAAEGAAPAPRAHFSATRVGDRVFVFGGYGGGGQVFCDTWGLHCGAGGAFRWQDVTGELAGEAPAPRFDHAAFAFPTAPNSDACDKLMVSGGRDAGQVLADAFVLDLESMAWERAPAAPGGGGGAGGGGPGACCAVAISVESVPFHKVRRAPSPSPSPGARSCPQRRLLRCACARSWLGGRT